MNITELAMLKKITGKGGASVELDTTLTQEGKAADAKAVGDALKNFEFITEAEINEICGETIEIATTNEVKF